MENQLLVMARKLDRKMKKLKIKELFESGKTIREIAKEFDITFQRVQQILKEMNVDVKKGGGAKKKTLKEEKALRSYDKNQSVHLTIRETGLKEDFILRTLSKYGRDYKTPAKEKSDPLKELIINLYLSGLNQVQISKKLNVSQTWVSVVLREKGLTHEKKIEYLKKRVISMRKLEFTYQEISEQLGISVGTVWRYIKEERNERNNQSI